MQRFDVDNWNHPSLLFHLILWGGTCQSNPKFTGMASLTGQFTLGILCYSSKAEITGRPSLPPSILCGFWGSNSVPHICGASTETTDLSLQSLKSFLNKHMRVPTSLCFKLLPIINLQGFFFCPFVSQMFDMVTCTWYKFNKEDWFIPAYSFKGFSQWPHNSIGLDDESKWKH